MDRINDITKDCFNALTQVRHLDDHSQPMPEVLHQRMRTFVDRAMRRATELGFSQQDAQDIGYALVALIDEVVLSRQGSLRDFWLQRMLQLQYFNENVAGENFYVRLANLKNDTSRAEVMKVYYLCLLFGFQGKYRVRGGEVELANIIESMAHDLYRAGHLRQAELSPHGDRPKEAVGGVRRHWPILAISIGAVVFSVLVYVVLNILVSAKASDLVERIQDISSE